MSKILVFILKLILVVLPAFMIVAYWEYKLFSMPTSHSVKRVNLEKNIGTIEVLILGSSHAHHGINPRFFTNKTFNLANVSQPFYYDKELLLKYLPKMKNLKMVIVPVSYFSFEFSLRDSSEYWRTFFYAQRYGINLEDTPFYEFDIRRISSIALYGRQTAMEYAFENFSRPLTNVDSNGWEPLPGLGSCDAGPGRAQFHTQIMKKERILYSTQQLESLFEALNKHKIRGLLITTPVCPSYAKNVDAKKYAAMQKQIKYLSNKYKVPYQNYFTDTGFSVKDFTDGDHLNNYGTQKFSRKLAGVVSKTLSEK